jgi:hypothetical protein
MSDLKDCILVLMQITTAYNATQLGWRVELADGHRKIILRKKLKDMTYMDHNIPRLLEVLMNLPVSCN